PRPEPSRAPAAGAARRDVRSAVVARRRRASRAARWSQARTRSKAGIGTSWVTRHDGEGAVPGEAEGQPISPDDRAKARIDERYDSALGTEPGGASEELRVAAASVA